MGDFNARSIDGDARDWPPIASCDTRTTSSSWWPAPARTPTTLRDEVAAVLRPMGLRLSEAKTTIVHIDEGFDFLGFRIQRQRQAGVEQVVRLHLAVEEGARLVKAKVRTITRGGTNQPLAVLLRRVNPVLRGWANYFRHGVSKATFDYLRQFTWRRVICWLRHKHPPGHLEVAPTALPPGVVADGR